MKRSHRSVVAEVEAVFDRLLCLCGAHLPLGARDSFCERCRLSNTRAAMHRTFERSRAGFVEAAPVLGKVLRLGVVPAPRDAERC